MRTLFAVGAVALVMVGCTDAASAPPSPRASPSPSLATLVARAADDAELNQLTQGVLDLNSRIYMIQDFETQTPRGRRLSGIAYITWDENAQWPGGGFDVKSTRMAD